MTTFYSVEQTVINGPQFGQPPTTRIKANKLNGRIRTAEFTYIAPSSGTAPAIGDKIVFGKLPVGARILGHLSKLYFDAGTASSTLAIGDNIVAARHLAATAINAAGSAVPDAAGQVQSAVGDITTGSAQVTNLKSVGAYQVGMKITGTGIPTGTVITAIDRAGKTCTMSNAATATTASLAITTTGAGYEVTDDTNSAANGFASTTDDATLIGTVAGAQVANNQALTLKVAYVMD